MRSSGEIHGAGANSNRSSRTILMRSSRTIPTGASGVIANGPRQKEQHRERPREVEKEQPPDYSHAPPATPRKDATVKIVVMGDANADWLAYGLEDALSERPEIGIVHLGWPALPARHKRQR